MPPTPAALPPELQEGVRFALKLGRALHIYGAPATRLEAVMDVLSQEMGLRAHCMSMPTALMVSFDLPGEDGYAHLYRLNRNEQDFDKLAQLDRLWNDVVDSTLTPSEAIRKIDEIDEAPNRWNRWMVLLAFGLTSAAGSTFFGGGVQEMWVATACGLLLGLFLQLAGPRKELLGLHEVLGSSVVAAVATLGTHFLGADADVSILAGLIVLLPGFSITTAISELAQRNLVSGTARLAWSALLAAMLAFGVLAGQAAVEAVMGPAPVHEAIEVWQQWVPFVGILVAGVSIGVLFQAHPRDLFWITLAVCLPFLGMEAGIKNLDRELGIFLGGLIAGAGSNLYARAFDRPATIFRLPGILILVPGSLGFLSLTALTSGDPMIGLQQGFGVLTGALALVSGLLISNAVIPPRKAL